MILLHPDRYNLCQPSQVRKFGVVVHDSESSDGSSANLVAALKSPGDRTNLDGTKYGAGYHAVTNGVGGYVLMADGTAGPFAAPPANYNWWHVCMPGKASQTRDEWLDTLSRAHIKGVAKFIHDSWVTDGKTWSPYFVFADQLQRGVHGYTSHYQDSIAWKRSTHTDPGFNFPWDVLAADVYALTNPKPPTPDPSEEDEMKYVFVAVENSGSQYLWIPGTGQPMPFASVADRDKILGKLDMMNED